MSKKILISLRKLLDEKFGGLLWHGSHDADDQKVILSSGGAGKCCVLELVSVHKGLDWSDDPEYVGVLDLRPLNDVTRIKNATRTECLLPVIAAYHDSGSWPKSRLKAVGSRFAVALVRALLPRVFGHQLTSEQIAAARAVTTIDQAREFVSSVSAVIETPNLEDGLASDFTDSQFTTLVEVAAFWCGRMKKGTRKPFYRDVCQLLLVAAGEDPVEVVAYDLETGE